MEVGRNQKQTLKTAEEAVRDILWSRSRHEAMAQQSAGALSPSLL